jgi:4'-phosphopantetheinyl transferase
VLDASELARAERFRFERDRVRFVLRRAFARRVLARYLGVDPSAVTIRRTATGRPELDPPGAISFSTSHSDGTSVIALASGAPVGVDIERLRPIPDAMGIAQGLFAEQEVELLRSVPPASRSRIFLTLWTRKESVVKALGGGLSIALDGFLVLSDGDDEVGRPRSRWGTLPFAFAQLDEPRGYIGAVTVAGAQVAIRHMDPELVA